MGKPLDPTRSDNNMTSRVFTTMAIEDVHDISIVQQCRMLQSHIGIDCVSRCLTNLQNVTETFKSLKEELLKADYNTLLQSQSQHLSTKLVAEIARSSILLETFMGSCIRQRKQEYKNHAITFC